jgi:hypothetical protein
MSTTDQSSITTVTDDIATALQSSDEQTASSLQTLSLVHQARISQVTRYSAAVAAHFGAASPEATTAQAALSASQAEAVRSDIVNRQLSMAVPTAPAGGWALYGTVQDATGAPVPAQTVFFANAQGTFQSEYGYAYTDDAGSYSITEEAPAPSAEAEGSEPAPAPSAPELYLAVTNQKRQWVYLSSTPFEPTAGTATYMNVYLPAGGETIGAPPPGAKKPAPPPAPKSGKNTPSAPKSKGSGTT